MEDNYLPSCSYGKTPLTREYFEKNNWDISYPKIDDEETIWLASLNKTCDDCFGCISLEVSNCMYDWRFSVSGEVNGHGEGYFHGTVFVCTVEELETLLFDIAHIAWDYRINKKI